jgi:xanthine dehydrogenase/oxidase
MADVTFFLNGQPATVQDPSPDLLLIDYLRSPEIALAGPKKGCGQGGCGACTVILSSWDPEAQAPEHRAINSCLHPVCSLGGLSVTTVEGTGAARTPNPPHLSHTTVSTRSAMAPITAPPPQFVAAARLASGKRAQVRDAFQTALVERNAATRPSVARREQLSLTPVGMSFEGMNPVAYQLATNNGSQCGYCSVGFVMNMTEFLINHRSGATKAEIEAALDGHICRCTGYRPILTAMKTFASDWSKDDEANRMKCLLDDDAASQVPGPLVIPFPKAAEQDPRPFNSPGGDRAWYTPATLDELADLVRSKGARRLRLINGNTSFGVYPDEYGRTEIFVDLRLIRELHGPSIPEVRDGQIYVAAGTTYGDFVTLLETVIPQLYPDAKDPQRDTSHLAALLLMARRTAGRIVRNVASLGGNTMMVLQHIAPGTGSPFPSDLCTALVAVGAQIEYFTFSSSETRRETLEELIAKVQDRPQLVDDILLLGYSIPLGTADDVTFSQKVALRDVNSHTIVNATTRVSFAPESHDVNEFVLVFGGIAPMPWRYPLEAEHVGTNLSLAALPRLMNRFEQVVRDELARWADRMKDLPDEGFTDDYRVALAVSLYFKAVINALSARGAALPAEVASAGVSKWGTWPVSNGSQWWDAASDSFKAPVAQP